VRDAFDRSTIETKYFTINASNVLPSITSASQTYSPLTNLTQGTEFTQRVGRSIKVKELRLSTWFIGGQGGIATDDAFNCLRLVVCRMSVGKTLTLSLAQPLDPRLQDGLGHVYYDRQVTLISPGPSGVGYQPAVKEYELTLPMNYTQDFLGAGAGTLTNEYLAIVAVSDSGVGPHPGMLQGLLTVIYEDL
jgi:hypothetical protein